MSYIQVWGLDLSLWPILGWGRARSLVASWAEQPVYPKEAMAPMPSLIINSQVHRVGAGMHRTWGVAWVSRALRGRWFLRCEGTKV